jgi:pSer/pThr/pTyr-binding forkhead associated (FHA) protein
MDDRVLPEDSLYTSYPRPETADETETTVYYIQRLAKGPDATVIESKMLPEPVFRIGRDADLTHYKVNGNRFISRVHAEIRSRDGRHYIVDLGSMNKTFVGGAEIPPYTEVELLPGTTFRLHDEDFTFKSSKTANRLLFAQGLKSAPQGEVAPETPSDTASKLYVLEKLLLNDVITHDEYRDKKEELSGMLARDSSQDDAGGRLAGTDAQKHERGENDKSLHRAHEPVEDTEKERSSCTRCGHELAETIMNVDGAGADGQRLGFSHKVRYCPGCGYRDFYDLYPGLRPLGPPSFLSSAEEK